MIIMALLFLVGGMHAAENMLNKADIGVYVNKLSGGIYDTVDDIYDNGNKNFLVSDILMLHKVRRFVDMAGEIEWNVHKQQIPAMMQRMDPKETIYALHWEELHSCLAVLKDIKTATMGTCHTHAWGQLMVELKTREDTLSGQVKECIRAEAEEMQEASSGTDADTEILDSLTQMLQIFKEVALACENP